MVPVYSSNYIFGDWFLKTFIGVDPLKMNPHWMCLMNNFLYKYTGISGLSFWSFMVGGHLLGIIVSVMLYPVVKVIFNRVSYGVCVAKSNQKMARQ